MPIVNLRSREVNCKIVYCGPSLGGKTTNIKAIHGSLPDENRSPLQTIDTADDRTLFFDYFSMTLPLVKGMQARFLIYAVPGQDYYKATRKMVLQGVDGVVFVADSTPGRLQENIESLGDLKNLLTEHGYDYWSLPLVLQMNKRDLPDAHPLEAMAAALNERQVAVHEAVAIEGKGVLETFRTVCSEVVSRLNQDAYTRI